MENGWEITQINPRQHGGPNGRIRKVLETISLICAEKQPEIRNFHIAAAIVDTDRDILSIGFPRSKSHPIQKRFGNNAHSIYLHAEIDAVVRMLRKYPIDARKHSLYIVRVKNISASNFEYGIAIPCKGCMEFITHTGLRRIVTVMPQSLLYEITRKF